MCLQILIVCQSHDLASGGDVVSTVHSSLVELPLLTVCQSQDYVSGQVLRLLYQRLTTMLCSQQTQGPGTPPVELPLLIVCQSHDYGSEQHSYLFHFHSSQIQGYPSSVAISAISSSMGMGLCVVLGVGVISLSRAMPMVTVLLILGRLAHFSSPCGETPL